MTKSEVARLYRVQTLPIKTKFNTNSIYFNPTYNVSFNLIQCVRTAKQKILDTINCMICICVYIPTFKQSAYTNSLLYEVRKDICFDCNFR